MAPSTTGFVSRIRSRSSTQVVCVILICRKGVDRFQEMMTTIAVMFCMLVCSASYFCRDFPPEQTLPSSTVSMRTPNVFLIQGLLFC